MGNLLLERPARHGAVTGMGAFVLYLFMTLRWGPLGVGAAFGEAMVIGAVVGGLCYLQSRMHRRAP